jgi:hypothetical protein
MRLKIAIILVIIEAVSTFIFKIAGTFSPGLLKNLLVMKAFGIISLLLFLAIIAFFVIFFIDFAQKKHLLLQTASVLMIVGSSAVFLLFLKAVLSFFKIFPSVYSFAIPEFVEVLISGIFSAFTLFFFVAFYKEMITKMGFHLKLAVSLIIASSFINFVLKSLVFTNYLSSGGFNWFLTLFVKYQVVIVLISAFWFLSNLYFYISFYRELD